MPNRITAADASAAELETSSSQPRERSVVILDAETLEVIGVDVMPGPGAPDEVGGEGGVRPE